MKAKAKPFKNPTTATEIMGLIREIDPKHSRAVAIIQDLERKNAALLAALEKISDNIDGDDDTYEIMMAIQRIAEAAIQACREGK